MSDLGRITISLEQPLLRRLERLLKEGRHANRSEFIRDLVRNRLVERQWEADEEALGTITLIYDHHRPHLAAKLTAMQHHAQAAVLAATHVHLDHHLCAEMLMVRGKASHIRTLADNLGGQKGVFHTQLGLSTTGKKLS